MNMEINELFNYREHHDFCMKYLRSFEFTIFNYKMNGFALKLSLLKSALTNKWVRAWTTWVQPAAFPSVPRKKLPLQGNFWPAWHDGDRNIHLDNHYRVADEL